MAEWNTMTDKERMEWYQEQWKAKNVGYQLCNLEFLKTKEHPEGEWVLKVKAQGWAETTSATLKKMKDAKYLWDKLHKVDFVKKQSMHFNIQIPVFPKSYKKEYRSISTSLEVHYYDRVKQFCKDHNMTMGSLITMLLKKVVE